MTQFGQAKVYSKQGSTELTIDAGGYLNAASGKVTMPGVLGKGYIDLPLAAALEAASADSINALTSGTNPSISRINAGTDPKGQIYWSSNADKVQWDIMLPHDLSTAGGMILNLYGEASGTANTWGVGIFFGVGDADAGTTGPLTSTPANCSIAISSANIIANAPMTVLVGPTSASGLVRLYGARLVYSKASS